MDSLDSVAVASGNVLYRNTIVNIKENISTGQSLNFAMKNTEVFPNHVLIQARHSQLYYSSDEHLYFL